MKAIALLLLSLVLGVPALHAQESTYEEFGDYRIHYSAFNSDFVPPDVASLYNISRGKDQGLVNIAVVPTATESGKTALVSGSVTDMLARQQTLDFIEIREGEAVYYLAPFKFDNEDPLTFKVTVRPAGESRAHDLRFQRIFYQN